MPFHPHILTEAGRLFLVHLQVLALKIPGAVSRSLFGRHLLLDGSFKGKSKGVAPSMWPYQNKNWDFGHRIQRNDA